jgi:Ca-activated chloride channel family protein
MRTAWLALVALAVCSHSAKVIGRSGEVHVRITSPLGRTGAVGTVRIVAQIDPAPEGVIDAVRFYVDGTLLKTVTSGPPYAVEWLDANPFERCELAVEAEDSQGRKGRASVVLPAYEVTEASEVTSVLLEAGVYDRKGQFVSGLQAADFALREDGVAQTLDLVDHERVPATFALLIDSSQSMSRRFDFVKDAAGRLTQFLRPKDRVIVAPFSKHLEAITGPTADRRTVVEAIDAIRPAGGTSILDALVEMCDRLPASDDRRAVILISDGYDEHSASTIDDALGAAKKARVTVYVIGIGGVAGISLKGERAFKRLAGETGGRVFFPPRDAELAGVYDQLAADAQNRYLVTYTPANTRADGKWRAITLATTTGDYTVKTRAGYRAPAPPPIRPTLEFTVMDADGRYADVTAADLVVLENGDQQAIETFQDAVTPVSIVLALDASGSMRKASDALKASAREFVEALRPEDQLAVLFFSDGIVVSHDFAKDRKEVLEAIDEYKSAGGTALYDAVGTALTMLKQREGRRAVVVMTDGRDENNAGNAPGSRQTLADVLNLAKNVDAAIFPIGLGSNVDRPGLDEIATISGGRASFPADAALLAEEFHQTIENLRRRYVIGYTSTHTERDGSWRDVVIRSRSDNLTVHSRSGYFAPDR